MKKTILNPEQDSRLQGIKTITELYNPIPELEGKPNCLSLNLQKAIIPVYDSTHFSGYEIYLSIYNKQGEIFPILVFSNRFLGKIYKLVIADNLDDMQILIQDLYNENKEELVFVDTLQLLDSIEQVYSTLDELGVDIIDAMCSKFYHKLYMFTVLQYRKLPISTGISCASILDSTLIDFYEEDCHKLILKYAPDGKQETLNVLDGSTKKSYKDELTELRIQYIKRQLVLYGWYDNANYAQVPPRENLAKRSIKITVKSIPNISIEKLCDNIAVIFNRLDLLVTPSNLLSSYKTQGNMYVFELQDVLLNTEAGINYYLNLHDGLQKYIDDGLLVYAKVSITGDGNIDSDGELEVDCIRKNSDNPTSADSTSVIEAPSWGC